jgi:hypothetical protein
VQPIPIPERFARGGNRVCSCIRSEVARKCAVGAAGRAACSSDQTRSAGALAKPASTHGLPTPTGRGCCCCQCCCSLRAASACAAARFFRRCLALSTSICCCLHSSLQNGVSPLHAERTRYTVTYVRVGRLKRVRRMPFCNANRGWGFLALEL